MRAFLLIFCGLLVFSCVKQNSKDPIPKIEFIDFASAGKSPYSKSDTAVMVISYEDGDGDLFVNSTNDDANIIFTTYTWHEDTKTFVASFIPPPINDTFRITNKIKQPDNGYYKGKSIKGQLFMPLKEFRANNQSTIIKFVGFMVDMKKHKSNVVTSPVYTLNF